MSMIREYDIAFIIKLDYQISALEKVTYIALEVFIAKAIANEFMVSLGHGLDYLPITCSKLKGVDMGIL